MHSEISVYIFFFTELRISKSDWIISFLIVLFVSSSKCIVFEILHVNRGTIVAIRIVS